jgi:hypothetical protein
MVFSSCTYWQPSILLVKSTTSSANKKIYIFLVFSHQSWFPCSNVRGTQAGKRKLSFWEADNVQVYRGLKKMRLSKIPNELEEADEIEAAHWRWIVEPKQQTMCRRSFLPSLPRSKWIQAQSAIPARFCYCTYLVCPFDHYISQLYTSKDICEKKWNARQ